MHLSLQALAGALKDLVFPPACLACGAGLPQESPFCPACREQVELLTGPTCPRCGRPGTGPCLHCRQSPPAFDAAWALARHTGPLAQAVREFKYQGRWVNGPALAGLLARHAPPDLLRGVDLAAPVPLHPWRLLRRGFNQALVLARGLDQGRGPFLAPRLLRRLRHTRPQVGLPPAARAANVAGAFAVSPRQAHLVRGQRVLLIDDVYTTGATVNECARALKAAGAATVTVLTLVRAGGQGPGAEEA